MNANTTKCARGFIALAIAAMAACADGDSRGEPGAAPAGAALQLQVDGELQPALQGRVWVEVSPSAPGGWEDSDTRFADSAGRRWLALSPHHMLPDRASGSGDSTWSYYLSRDSCVLDGLSCQPSVMIGRSEDAGSVDLWDRNPDGWLEAEISVPVDDYVFTIEREVEADRQRHRFAATTVLLSVAGDSVEASEFVQELAGRWEPVPPSRPETSRGAPSDGGPSDGE